ncbi:MAG: hypothetical protein IT290_07580 [Deltaproteobacteria bacterium]|nr:hypothetical protein [Deltaproteobacteria bacterium]
MHSLTLPEIFSSSAKVALIETLYHHDRGLSLRELSELSGVQIRSAQLAVESLREHKIVRTRREKNRVIVSPRKEQDVWTLLSAICRELEAFKIRERAAQYESAAPILKFISSGRALVDSAARKSRHE